MLIKPFPFENVCWNPNFFKGLIVEGDRISLIDEKGEMTLVFECPTSWYEDNLTMGSERDDLTQRVLNLYANSKWNIVNMEELLSKAINHRKQDGGDLKPKKSVQNFGYEQQQKVISDSPKRERNPNAIAESARQSKNTRSSVADQFSEIF